jgi:transcription elongation GreA/GreB family factor
VIERTNILAALSEHINTKIRESEMYLNGLIDSRNNDTKSSAGDKYETGRSMMQQEIDRAEDQLQQQKIQRNELERLMKLKPGSRCEIGSIISIDDELFLIGPALGKVEIEGGIIFSISMGSPLGRLLIGKKEGEAVHFRGKLTVINRVI